MLVLRQWHRKCVEGLLEQGENSALVLHRLISVDFQQVLESRCMPTHIVQPQPLASCLTEAAWGQSSWNSCVEMCCDVFWRAKQQARNQPLHSVVCCVLPLILFSLFGSSYQNELIWDFQAVECFSSGSFLLSTGLWGLAAI